MAGPAAEPGPPSEGPGCRPRGPKGKGGGPRALRRRLRAHAAVVAGPTERGDAWSLQLQPGARGQRLASPAGPDRWPRPLPSSTFLEPVRGPLRARSLSPGPVALASLGRRARWPPRGRKLGHPLTFLQSPGIRPQADSSSCHLVQAAPPPAGAPQCPHGSWVTPAPPLTSDACSLLGLHPSLLGRPPGAVSGPAAPLGVPALWGLCRRHSQREATVSAGTSSVLAAQEG